MADDRLTSSLQVSVLATLCFDKEHGAAIAAQVRPDHFDQVWRDFAARVLKYRRQYGKPPGNDTNDIADQVAVGGKSRDLFRNQLMPELFAEAEGLNALYAATRVTDFIRHQTLKAALVEASDRYSQGNENVVNDIEAIFRRALTTKATTYDIGTFLNDPKALTYMDDREDVIPLGIRELDRMGIGIVAKQVILYIAPKGTGKTWFCVHCGKQTVKQGLKAVHYTLEMGEEEVTPRYYQSMFAVARNSDKYRFTPIKTDKHGHFVTFDTEWRTPKPGTALTHPGVKAKLRNELKSMGNKFANICIKEFPTSMATVSNITSHLDYLEEKAGFVPNVMIVDYPKLMKADRNNLRVDIGRNVEELRGVCVQRNMAGIFPHQGTRQTIGAKRVKSSQAGEDISVVQTADTVLAFSRTEEEERRGLGRLSVEHARRTRAGEVILLSQSYATGQYVLNSAPMDKAYWERMREVTGDDEAGEDEE